VDSGGAESPMWGTRPVKVREIKRSRIELEKKAEGGEDPESMLARKSGPEDALVTEKVMLVNSRRPGARAMKKRSLVCVRRRTARGDSEVVSRKIPPRGGGERGRGRHGI